MCIAILNTKKGGKLPKKQIQNSWDNNDMGSGLLWNKDGKLNVFKSYDYEEYVDKYNELRDDNTIGTIVLHFRIATSGYNGEHNLHPFLVNDDLGFVHNGVIKGLGNKTFSDTYEFNDMLKKYKHNFLNSEFLLLNSPINSVRCSRCQ
jgi:predicted glutamine amidotransferase